MIGCIKLAIQLGSLIVAAFGLVFLVKYVRYTKEIAEQAGLQTEATSKPAVIAVQTGAINDHPRLRNIGTGPALDVEWAVSDTKKAGGISYIEASKESGALDVDLSALQHGAVLSGANKVAILCSYRGISGLKYSSVSDYDFLSGRFSTTFGEG